MKIGIFDPYLDTLSGGEKYMLTLAKCLAKNNEVSIFWDKDSNEIKNIAKNKLGIDLGNIKFTRNIFGPNIKFITRYFDSRNFDLIIYLSDGSIPLVASNLILHFQFPVEWVKPSLKTKLKLLRISKVISNSQFTKNFIDKKFGIKSNVLYPPVSAQKVSSKKENIILHVGRFGLNKEGGNYKKQDIMIKAFKEMVDKGLNGWEFVLVLGVMKGEEEKVKSLRNMIGKYPVEIAQNISDNVLSEYYQQAKIYWHATGFGEDLNKNPEKAEHFGISTVEAMSAGAVPIVINEGGQKEIVEDGSGFLWNSIDEFRDKTLKIANDNLLFEQMSKAAIERSKLFTGDRFCKELAEIIK